MELAVIDASGEPHCLYFPCRRTIEGWVNATATTGKRVDGPPTHWREWKTKP